MIYKQLKNNKNNAYFLSAWGIYAVHRRQKKLCVRISSVQDWKRR